MDDASPKPQQPEHPAGQGWSDDGLLDQIDIPIYAVDAQSLCVRLNPAAERLLGYTQAEVLGRDMHDLVHSMRPDGTPYPKEECLLMQARRNGRAVHDLQEVFWSKTREAIPVECSATPVVMNGGESGAVITLKDQRSRRTAEHRYTELIREQIEMLRQRDATARIERELAAAETIRQRELSFRMERAATDQLREQQELLSTVAETAPVGIAVFDSAVRFRWYNHSYQGFLDEPHRNRNLVGCSFFELFPEKELDGVRAIVGNVQNTGETFVAEEFPYEDPERGRTYWRWSLSRLANGELMTVNADITEQVLARREIETIYANAPIALSLVSANDFRILRANRQQADILGVAVEDLPGKTVAQVLSFPDLQATLERVAQGKPVYNQVVSGELRNKPGMQHSLLINAFPNFGEDGTVESISLAGSDITAQKRAEEALVQADKLAAVGRLAASISHEINNPLESVTNLLYLVHADPALSAESREYVKLAESELSRVSQISAQTLRFHRHAIGAVARTPQQVVEPVIALYQGRLKNSRVRVERDYRDNNDMFCFEGDVRQILNNLIGNAIDAMQKSGGTIRVRTRSAACPRLGLRGTRITVADSGQGMSPETLSHIFEPFYTTKGAAGSGLGLWISHTLAKRHGGSLTVRSSQQGVTPGRQSGTSFSLFVPYAQNESQGN